MDWGQLLRSPWVWGGAGVAGVAGLVVFLRNRGKGGSDAAPANDSPAYTTGGVGSFDSTGTDVAHWLGSYSASLDAQYAEFRRDILDQISQLGSEAPSTPTTPAPQIPGSGGGVRMRPGIIEGAPAVNFPR